MLALLHRQLAYIDARHCVNDSLTEEMCQLHVFRTSSQLQDIQNMASIVDSVLSSVGTQLHQKQLQQYLQWLNLFVFNVTATNEEYFRELQDQLLQSTQSRGSSKQGNSDNEIMVLVRNNLRHWLFNLLKGTFLTRLITISSVQTVARNPSLKQLLETIDYVSLKYTIQVPTKAKIVQLIEGVSHLGDSTLESTNVVSTINGWLFNEGSFQAFINIINNNVHLRLDSAVSIINSNYRVQTPQRPIFSSAQCTGRRTMQQIMDELVRRVDKNDLFGEKMQTLRTYELFGSILWQRFASLYAHFTDQIVLPVSQLDADSQHTTQSLQSIQECAQYFSHRISQESPSFQQICVYLHSIIAHRYGQEDSIQIMKKLILNRFLLNPKLFVELYRPTKDLLQAYVLAANRIRVLYYEEKAQTLQTQQSNPLIGKLSASLRDTLVHYLAQKIKPGILRSDKGIYTNDKVLRGRYLKLYDDLRGQGGNSVLGLSHKQMSNDSISFTFTNNEASQHRQPSRLSKVNSSRNEQLTYSESAGRNSRCEHPSAFSEKHHLQSLSGFQEVQSKHSLKDSSLRAMIDGLIDPKSSKGNDTKSSKDKDKLGGEGKPKEIQKTSLPPKSMNDSSRIVSNEQEMINTLVQLRSDYGARKRQVAKRCEVKRIRRQNILSRLLLEAHHLEQRRKEVQRQSNLVHINLSLA